MNTALYSRLLEEIRQIPVIDAHEHLQEESWRISQPVDVFTLFSHYTHNDLVTAGMSREDCDRTQDPEVPLDERWALFEPWWERARHTSYCRAALIAAKRFFDADDITADNYVEISERIQGHNTPGLYDRVLKEACGIRICLTQCGRLVEENQDILRPMLPLPRWAGVSKCEEVEELAAELDTQVSTLDDYCDLIRAALAELKAKGVVGFKIHAGRLEEADRAAASGLFDRMISDDLQPDNSALRTFLIHETIEACGELALPVAVHCGIAWTNWNDFTVDHPRHMIPVILAHRNTRFDLYHAGIPWIRETGIIGKSYEYLIRKFAEGGGQAALVGRLCHRVLEGWRFDSDDEFGFPDVEDASSALKFANFKADWKGIVEESFKILKQFMSSQAFAEIKSLEILGREIPFIYPCSRPYPPPLAKAPLRLGTIHAIDCGFQINPRMADCPRVMRGTIDLLCKEGEKIIIIDYKSEHVKPASEKEYALRYSAQGQAYKDAVGKCLPPTLPGGVTPLWGMGKGWGNLEFQVVFLRSGISVAV